MEVRHQRPEVLNYTGDKAREAGLLPNLGILWSTETWSSFGRDVIQEFGDWKTHNQCFLRHSSSNDKGWACGYCFGCKDIKELMMLLFSVCFSEDPKTLIVSIAEKHYWDEHKLIISPWCVSEYAYQDSNKHLNQ